jgi:D-proline reductase (dithiol) PrdB
MAQPQVDFVTDQILKAWIEREPTREIPWTPLGKPLAQCTVAIVSTAGLALTSDRPFDQEGERRNPWWGDPDYRVLPRGTRTGDVTISHLHISSEPGQQDLDCVLPLTRLAELAAQGVIGGVAPSHYSIMGFLLKPQAMLARSLPRIVASMQTEAVDLALLVPV